MFAIVLTSIVASSFLMTLDNLMRLSSLILSPLVASSFAISPFGLNGLFSKPNHLSLSKLALAREQAVKSLLNQTLSHSDMKMPLSLMRLNALNRDDLHALNQNNEPTYPETYHHITAKIDQKFWPIFERAGITKEAWIKGLQLWSGEGRYYHSPTHLQSLLNDIEAIHDPLLSEPDRERLIIVAFFHDVIYQVNKPVGETKTNEQKSVEYYLGALDASHSADSEVVDCILATQNLHAPEATPKNALARRFWLLDYGIVKKDFAGLLIWERDIFKEFSPFCTPAVYKEKRVEFLQSCFTHPDLQLTAEQKDNLSKLIENVQRREI